MWYNGGIKKHGKGGKRNETFLDLFDLRGGNVRHRFCSLRVRQMEGEKGALAGAGKGAVSAGSFRGSLGFLTGMVVFRHKTNHWSFRIGVPVLSLLWTAVTVALIWKTAL